MSHRACRGETGLAGHQRAGVADMEAVHVFVGRDRLDHLVRVDLRRQRQLHQDAVDARIRVEFGNARQHAAFGNVGG